MGNGCNWSWDNEAQPFEAAADYTLVSGNSFGNDGCRGDWGRWNCGCGCGNGTNSGCGCGNGSNSGCGNGSNSGCGCGNGTDSGCGCGNGSNSGCGCGNNGSNNCCRRSRWVCCCYRCR